MQRRKQVQYTKPFSTDRVDHLGLRTICQRYHLGALLVPRVYLDDGHGAVRVVDGLHHGLGGEVGHCVSGPLLVVVWVLCMVVICKVRDQVLTAMVLVAVTHDGS